MRANGLIVGSVVLVAASAVLVAAGQSASQNSPSTPSAQALPQQQAQSHGASLQVRTRLVTVDVVATDSHGNVVRDLKPEELEISDGGGPQRIARFSFVDKSADSGATKLSTAAQTRPKGFYTNQAAVERLTTPPTVILLDALNTEGTDLLQARHEMIRMLTTLPPNTPVAVLLLGQSVVVAQDFTSDPALLRAALGRTLNSGTTPAAKLDKVLKSDSSGGAATEYNANGGTDSGSLAKATQSLEDFERATYTRSIDDRATTTLDALTALAHYLGGYKGRKNLIWVSASFPIYLVPDAESGADANGFGATSVYGEKVQDAANALTDAQVAVYPIDARGLVSEVPFSASEAGAPRSPNKISTIVSGQLERDGAARTMARDTMDLLAHGTGGKTCTNTNDLSGCVNTALADSSTYYQLAYSPQSVKWDGSFRAISVKTTRPGVKLAYRRGYFARDAENLARSQTKDQRLQQACMDMLPSTAIPITVQAVAPAKSDDIRYLMTVAPAALSFSTDGPSHKLNAATVTCVFHAKGNSFQFYSKDLTQSFSDAAYQDLHVSGLSGYVEVPKAGARRVRIAVLDIDTGLTGALDVPVRPEDFANVAAAPATATNLPEVLVPRKGKESTPAPSWNPPDVDAAVPTTAAVPPCALAGVLKVAGQRAEELGDHLQNFDAQEQVRFEQTDPQGMGEQSMAAKFDYLVDFGEQSGHKLHETRTFVAGSGDANLGAFVDVGLPAFALIFHPALQGDYEMRCDGLAQWNGRPAWVVYFEQTKKKRPRTVSMGTASASYPVGVKGRAWIAAGSGQIVHMETNLVSGLAALELRSNAVSVDYAPVKFHSQNVEVWLPQSAMVYTEYFRRRTIIQHTFSDFQLFSVGTQQVIQKPAQK
jgi:VWFA-related protein